MHFENPGIVAGYPRLASPTAEDWSRYRPVITQLYHSEDRKLEEVMAIMANTHSFRPTKQMYKKKIAKWNLNKKLKEDHVLQILHIRASRTRENAQLVFFVRGKCIGRRRLRRYINQHPSVMVRFKNGEAPSAESREIVTYQIDRVQGQLKHRGEDSRAHSVEQLMYLIQRYVSGCFDSNIWTHDSMNCWSTHSSAENELSLHDSWHSPFVGIMAALSQKSKSNMNQILGRFFDSLSGVVKAHPPFFLSALMGMTFRMQDAGEIQLTRILLQHVSALVKIYLGETHGLYHVAHHLNHLVSELEDDRYWYEQSFHLLVASYEGRTGADNSISIYLIAIFATISCLNGCPMSKWFPRLDRDLHLLTQNCPDADASDSFVDGDLWNLDCLSDLSIPPTASKLLSKIQHEIIPRPEHTPTGSSYSHTSPMALAKRQWRLQFLVSSMNPKLISDVADWLKYACP